MKLRVFCLSSLFCITLVNGISEINMQMIGSKMRLKKRLMLHCIQWTGIMKNTVMYTKWKYLYKEITVFLQRHSWLNFMPWWRLVQSGRNVGTKNQFWTGWLLENHNLKLLYSCYSLSMHGQQCWRSHSYVRMAEMILVVVKEYNLFCGIAKLTQVNEVHLIKRPEREGDERRGDYYGICRC